MDKQEKEVLNKRTTIHDVAHEAGVSMTTVSHALNGYKDVNEQTRQKIVEIARRLDYMPDEAGRSLRGTDRDTAEKMAELTKGYPFAFQVLGYLTWNHSGHYEVVIDEYEQYLSEFVYDKIWSELSQKDRIVARGIAETESGKIKEIREHLGMETNEFNPYRKRLIKKGIVSGETRGYVFFTLPLFERYVIDNS